jgi:hypothetical protein
MGDMTSAEHCGVKDCMSAFDRPNTYSDAASYKAGQEEMPKLHVKTL